MASQKAAPQPELAQSSQGSHAQTGTAPALNPLGSPCQPLRPPPLWKGLPQGTDKSLVCLGLSTDLIALYKYIRGQHQGRGRAI